MDGLDSEAERDRKMFCQAHYSMALFANRLFDVADRGAAAVRKAKADGTSDSCDVYLQTTENITLFLALLGQVCDMVEEIARSLNDNEIATKVNGFMRERNNAIHAARVPMSEDYVGVKIAVIEHNMETAGGYKNRLPWDAVDVTKFQHLAEWFEETRDQLFEVLRTPVYPMVEKAAQRRFGGRTVRPLSPLQTSHTSYSLPPAPAYSVYRLPSDGGTNSGDISGKK